MMRYENKVVLVTGGATGIGRATCQAFAREGAAVMIGDLNDDAGDTAEMIRSEGGRAVYRKADVRDSQAMSDLVAQCVDEFGGLHAAFNNAGVLPPPVPFHEVPEKDLDLIMDVDLKGVFFAMQAQVRHFLENGGGAIVNTASVAGKVADPNMSAYVAAKHAVVGLTKAVAIEYAQQGIRVNCIGPGLVATPMTQAWLDSPEFREMFFQHNVIGRAAQPEEIAGTVLHLCSDEASFTNGSFFVMDGGQTSH
ncbi:SDR family NAD(P)-dependent oxidoreductase [Aurantiacibacter rhizosphaerae]|uniref:Glucose 1-dehydrogenase n=1 Tax=Aurantiacibacter rhizosphaerae TaxID=2691582 RepID=A0A844XB17_9SPHN|nr:glucose 1-dehydrogenase [Aurantiacibacter rhizosphaerae]MWV27156.1 glucose 1-dehydrogenase [Aurantiacibacter rhizosphaerae]